MKIEKNYTLRQIKELFHHHFPGLKIEFYKNSHGDHQGSPKQAQYSDDLLLSDILPDFEKAEIFMDNQLTVFEFEKQIEDQLGIPVQVFRKSRELWLQTISTDDWTLETQNRKGMHSIR